MASLAISPVGAPETEKSHTGLNEPSMEDILASIRRIIAEDQSNSLGRSGLGSLTRRAAAAVAPGADTGPAAMAAPAPAQAIDTEAVHEHAPERPVPVRHDPPVQPLHVPPPQDQKQPTQQAGGSSPAVTHPIETKPPQAATAAPAAEPAPPPPTPAVEDVPLISPSAGESITSSFHALAETVLLQDPDMVERVARDILRPMLKTWLDDNLPSIVERLVRVEIERVARGGRGRD